MATLIEHRTGTDRLLYERRRGGEEDVSAGLIAGLFAGVVMGLAAMARSSAAGMGFFTPLKGVAGTGVTRRIELAIIGAMTLAAWLVLLAASLSAAEPKPRLAVVIDDFGLTYKKNVPDESWMAIRWPVTFAVMPESPRTKEAAKR